MMSRMARKEFTSAKELLPRVLGQLSRGTGNARHLLPLWPQLVGQNIAARARPVRLEGGQLWIAVEGPAWEAELSRHAPVLLERFAAALGAGVVRDLRFVRAQAP
jgi:predicted nucleic acid-binding Zn ribbon protein